MLDLLITSHLFQTYTDIDQGELTDLRSAVVSNGNFSKVAVRNNFHKYLQHGSTALSQKITEYYNCVEWGDNCTLDFSFGTSEGPKVKISFLCIAIYNYYIFFTIKILLFILTGSW